MNEHPEIFFPSTDEKPLEQLTDEEFWDRAREQVQRGPVAVDVQPEHSREYLECHCRRGRFLIPLAAVYEVVPSPQQFTLLPAAPGWMLGLTAWHGEAMAVIDLDAYLSSAATTQLTDSPHVEGQFIDMDLEVPASPRPSLVDAATGYLLIGDHSDMPVGLLVPAVGPVISIQAELLDASPADTPAVKGMYGEAFVLDVAVLLADVVRQIGMVGGL